MLSVRHSDGPTLERTLTSEGGFVWWYVDLVDDRGDGAVLIWSYGLPFLPGARRRPAPASRPGINLVTYEGGRATGYVLQQLPPEHVRWRPGSTSWRVGDSTLDAEVTADRVTLTGALDIALPSPGGRWRGSLDVTGPRCRMARPSSSQERARPASVEERADDPEGSHGWSPFTCFAEGRLELEDPTGRRFSVAGRAYFDTNASAKPLDQLGIEDWRWGRYAFADHELIYYLVWPEGRDQPAVHLLLRVDGDGTVAELGVRECRLERPRRNRYGLTYPRHLRIEAHDGTVITIAHRHVVDEGPFYLRFISEGRYEGSGECAVGVAERVVPARVDRPWQRPFVAMRRHLADGDNSMWLPLFSGPRDQRWRRLWRAWTGRGASIGAPSIGAASRGAASTETPMLEEGR
ncbi:MAG: hypothetical protein AAF928_00200 [Myxococcota bacterium]